MTKLTEIFREFKGINSKIKNGLFKYILFMLPSMNSGALGYFNSSKIYMPSP